jgi:hypothetical protein
VGAQPVPGKPAPKVKLPGSNTFVPLSQAENLPPGTTVDVTGDAEIQLADPTGQLMTFYDMPDGVPSVFVLNGVQNGFVQISLTGGSFSKSSSRHVSVADVKKKKKPVRRLWGSGKGKFKTKGKYAAATVLGTIWLVADYTDHTLVTVNRGIVSVQDLVNKKTIIVKAGHSVIVNAKPKTTKHKPKKAPKKTQKR